MLRKDEQKSNQAGIPVTMLKNSKYSEVDPISVYGYQEILLRQPPQHRERVNLHRCRESKER